MSEQSVTTTQDNEFASQSMVPLFVKYAGLAFIGLLAQGIMVFCEGIIIGNGLGTEGLAIVAILMPIEYVNLALHGFFGIGISTLCAMKLGDGEAEEARKYFSYGVWASIILTVILTALAFIFASPLAAFLGAPEEIMSVAPNAIRIFVLFIPFATLGQICNYMVRLDEKPKLGSFVVTASAVISLAWLYVSTYVFHFGSLGAAIYYGLTIGLWAVLLIYFIVDKKTAFKIYFSDLTKIEMSKVMEIAKIGFPYLFVQVATSVFSVVVNNIVGNATSLAAWAVISGYTLYLLMMIMQACTQGVQPIASYNLGAKHYDRVKSSMTVSVIGTIVSVYVLVLIYFLFNRQLCSLLCGGDSELVAITMKANLIIAAGCGVGMVADLLSGYFQSVGRIAVSTILALSRYILFGVPCMLILKGVMGEDGIWYGMTAGCILAFILSMVFFFHERSRLDKMSEQ